MLRIVKVSSAFIGIIVGAGFASGQEILQYFTSFGYLGTMGAFIAMILFAYLGMTLTRLGNQMKTTSHKDVIYEISGRYLGVVVDYIIIFTLFGVGVVMIAGGGSILHQQLGLPPFMGSAFLSILVMLTLMLNVQKIIAIIGSITPFLILSLLIVGICSLLTMDISFAALDPIAKGQPSPLPHWFIAAVNYVSFNIAVGAAMVLVMGGAEQDRCVASIGGFIGGLGIGILIMISHLAIYSKVHIVANFDMPLLKIVDGISPSFAIFMSLVLFGMIFNTAVSMFYAFVARFTQKNTQKSDTFIIVTILIGFFVSFVGFTDLVAFFYPLIGYLGLFLVGALIYAPFRLARSSN